MILSTEEYKYQGRDGYRQTKGTHRNLPEVILMLSSHEGKIKDKITEGDEVGGSQKLGDSGLRKLR